MAFTKDRFAAADTARITYQTYGEAAEPVARVKKAYCDMATEHAQKFGYDSTPATDALKHMRDLAEKEKRIGAECITKSKERSVGFRQIFAVGNAVGSRIKKLDESHKEFEGYRETVANERRLVCGDLHGPRETQVTFQTITWKQCTRRTTPARQTWVHCRTCFPDREIQTNGKTKHLVVCKPCSEVCHDGHDVVELDDCLPSAFCWCRGCSIYNAVEIQS